jgi:hypothetical protein
VVTQSQAQHLYMACDVVRQRDDRADSERLRAEESRHGFPMLAFLN